MDAYSQGMEANYEGLPQSANPHQDPVLREQWSIGWSEAQMDREAWMELHDEGII